MEDNQNEKAHDADFYGSAASTRGDTTVVYITRRRRRDEKLFLLLSVFRARISIIKVRTLFRETDNTDVHVSRIAM